MNQKYKLALQISAIVLLLVFTSFTSIKFRDWFPARTKINIVWEDCIFKDEPNYKAVKDTTNYYFKGCKVGPNQFGEFTELKDVEAAIAKLDKMEGKK